MKSSHKKQTGSVTGPMLLVIIPLLVLAGGGFGVYQWYLSEKRALIKAIEELPEFSEEKAAIEAARELNIHYPPKPISESYKTIKKRIKKEIKKLVRKKFSPKLYSKKIIAIMRQYGPAKKGQRITFQLKNSNDMISGIYLGKQEEQNQGIFVRISGDRKFLITDIMKDYMYLFNPSDSQVTVQAKLKEFKSQYKENKINYTAKIKEQLEKKYFSDAGFVKDKNGRWKDPAKLIAEQVEKKRKIFEAKRRKEIKKLKEQHKFLGVFLIPVKTKTRPGPQI